MKLKLLILVLALQSAWILGTTVVQERTLAQGKLIRLETRPVDPRDMLRGDYVILSYKISDVPTNLFSPPLTGALAEGRTVFVALAPRGEFYEAVKAGTEPFLPEAGQVLLQGRSRDGWNSTQQRSVRVKYRLERYYVREGTGNPRGRITVQVAVPDSGRGQIKEVFVDGKPYAEAMKASER